MSHSLAEQLKIAFAKSDKLHKIAIAKYVIRNAEIRHNNLIMQRDSEPWRAIEYIDLILESSEDLYKKRLILQDLEELAE